MTMHIEILNQPFDPWDKLARYQQDSDMAGGSYGATAAFIGTMRDFNEDEPVLSMTLEHYPGMTESCLQQIYHRAADRWALLDALILHRVGELKPNDPIVLVAVWSAHRAAAFEACRYIMEELKSRAPFWKKEQLRGGSRWLEKNTAG